jgi:8-oxo-dGTP diphosphatase
MHEWLVAGALVESDGRLLLVRNVRRGGYEDWSTPGGVIDASDASVLDGLTREVEEETGLRVTDWEGPLYEVEAVAIDLGWTMRCEVHRAVAFEGEVRIGDPDGIVVEAAFVPLREATTVLASCHRWVGEPLGEWLAAPWGPTEARRFSYEVRGRAREAFDIVRL